ncbi:hypothetical protein MVEN_01731900 [Mycena venus]|uniref:Uncharacterized protein n=1 Tax=Mycena venus TaxID=2733690 RepID=A0A8H7CP25_9AGAR|nr:hypothetical protein MVEN_01731900 [Mycena venus]
MASLSYDSMTTYVDLIRLLKSDLSAMQPPYRTEPPDSLPVNIHDFLKLSLGLTDEIAKLAWQELRITAWSHNFSPVETLAARTKHIQAQLFFGAWIISEHQHILPTPSDPGLLGSILR